MSQEKKKRIHRSPEAIAELILAAERSSAAEICRREGISPAQFYRWRERFKVGGVASIKSTSRRGRRTAENPEFLEVRKENERLKAALVESSIELQLLKKSVSSGYTET